MRLSRILIATVLLLPTLGFRPSTEPATPIADEVVPHGQDRLPNPPKSPEEAARAMTVPEGFSVEIVAAEPDLVNPVAMTFDEKGRIWVTESLEYNRRSPGPGRDRVKVLEDRDGDGRAETTTIFADGLNIPSGIAVGYGGVWVANSPDILFYPNADGDLTPDGPPEVIVSGFGRTDTHELPNSLTWGPDGWLYGWNGVFNYSHVEHRGETFDFTCAIFRIHPVTRDFELFCEGTSNPWGIAIDPEGSLFASACVIDHLWHLVESGYYHRQGGPYPPYTWKIESIVDHYHQKRAYCGIHYFDGDAYPEEYRGKLYMGNIHGNAINVDSLTRDGSTYRGHGEPDFLSANDAWFMPVVQKTGPDGCLYVLDWYDRYHCYQDANRDPEGIDRLKGRLYRVRYEDAPRRTGFDLARESDEKLIQILDDPNDYDRRIARRLLTERLIATKDDGLRAKLESASFATDVSRKSQLQAIWALVSAGSLDSGFHLKLLTSNDDGFRAWGIRAAGNQGEVSVELQQRIPTLWNDPSPDVRLQLAIASRKIEGVDTVSLLGQLLGSSGEDEVIPRIIWQNAHNDLAEHGVEFLSSFSASITTLGWPEVMEEFGPRLLELVLSETRPEALEAAEILLQRVDPSREIDARILRANLSALASIIEQAGLSPSHRPVLRTRLQELRANAERLQGRVAPQTTLEIDLVLAALGDREALQLAGSVTTDRDRPAPLRLRAFSAQVAAEHEGVLEQATEILSNTEESPELYSSLIGTLGRLDEPGVAPVLLNAYPNLPPELQPKAAEVLTQRPVWTRALLKSIGAGKIPTTALNVTQIRKLLGSPDDSLVELVEATWGTVREGRDPSREAVIDQIRSYLAEAEGNPVAGRLVFNRLCAQCHQIYGEGQKVGPDLTGNGRGSYEQLLSNVYDPNLVIGAAYQATMIATVDGRVLTGLLEEDNEQRVVLRLQGGEREVIPLDNIEARQISPVSLMPENLEEQTSPQEMADLWAFLCLERAPEDPDGKPIDGTPRRLIDSDFLNDD